MMGPRLEAPAACRLPPALLRAHPAGGLAWAAHVLCCPHPILGDELGCSLSLLVTNGEHCETPAAIREAIYETNWPLQGPNQGSLYHQGLQLANKPGKPADCWIPQATLNGLFVLLWLYLCFSASAPPLWLLTGDLAMNLGTWQFH